MLQLGRSAHVINVRVGDDDLLHRQPVSLHHGHDVFDVVAGIDDHGFFCLFIADHRAIALQRADREDLVDHGSKLPRSGGDEDSPRRATLLACQSARPASASTR